MATHPEFRVYRRPSASPELDHWTCCRADVTFCGLDASDLPVGEFEVASCVVCDELEPERDGVCWCPLYSDGCIEDES